IMITKTPVASEHFKSHMIYCLFFLTYYHHFHVCTKQLSYELIKDYQHHGKSNILISAPLIVLSSCYEHIAGRDIEALSASSSTNQHLVALASHLLLHRTEKMGVCCAMHDGASQV
ncbi:hypothetical protein L9F63_018968, partial [Diploptera punctata]